MSLTKEWLDRINEDRRKCDEMNRANGCGCHYNWDDKFEVYCPEHAEAEAFERAREEQEFEAAMLNADNDHFNDEIADGVFF